MRRYVLLLIAFLIALAPPSAKAQAPNTIVTVAGGGTNSGAANTWTLSQPPAAVRDTAGNTYISDSVLCVVYKVDTAGTLSIYAGNGIFGVGGDGGPATSAGLTGPEGLALDANGNLFIADNLNNRIRRVDAVTHIITTVAGSEDPFIGAYTGDGGLATLARLNQPFGVAVDSNGNIFISDTGNNVIRRVDSGTQVITTYAGNGLPGTPGQANGDGGVATSAQLNFPVGLQVDANGNLYIADSDDSVIRVVNATTKIITTYAGSPAAQGTFGGDGGPATSAGLFQPFGISLDGTGNLYIADTKNQRIRFVSSTGTHTITTIAGNGTLCLNPASACGDGAAATSASLNHPTDVFIDSTNKLLIADAGNQRIRSVNAGTISNFGGGASGGDGAAATSAILSLPNSLVVDSTGNLFIMEQSGERVRRVDATTHIISTYAGTGARGERLSSNGNGGQAVNANFVNPLGVAIDGPGNIYVVDINGAVVRKIDAVTKVITTVAGNGLRCGEAGNPNTAANNCGDGGAATSASLLQPVGIAVDSLGQLYISDVALDRIRMVNAQGTISNFAGTGATGFSGDGEVATSAQLNQPFGLAVDSQQNVFIADSGNNAIRKVDNVGTISTYAFQQGFPGFSGDGGSATAASMTTPQQVAVDDKGNLYIGGGIDNVVRRVDAQDQSIITVAGDIENLGGGFSGDGGPSVKALIGNLGSAIDAAHNLYIADGFERVRKVNLRPVTTESGSFTAFPPTLSGTIQEQVQEVSFSNSGLDDLVVTVTGPPASSGFQLGVNCAPGGIPPCTVIVPPQESGFVEVVFAPPHGVAGTLNGTLTITTNDSANPSFSFPLTGTATNTAFALNVTVTPANSGLVSSSPSGISCGIPGATACSANFAQNAQVTLSEFPNTGFAFSGWSGAGCSGTADCVVTMTQIQNVMATFIPATPPPPTPTTVSAIGNGSGVITSTPAGITCTYNGTTTSGTCSFTFPVDFTPVTFTVTPNAGSKLAGWLPFCISMPTATSCQTVSGAGFTLTAVFSVTPQAFTAGQVFAGAAGGMIFVYNPDGTLAQVLGSGNFVGNIGGIAFDTSGNLYAANPTANTGGQFPGTVERFGSNGSGPTAFGSGYDATPQSIVVAPTGEVYVAQSSGRQSLLKFAAAGGAATAEFFPPQDTGPIEWIELLDDNNTMLYTTTGNGTNGENIVKAFDVHDNIYLPDLTQNLPGPAVFGLRELPDKSVLVADGDRIVRVNPVGVVTQTYQQGTGLYHSLNLDPDGITFWTLEDSQGTMFRINIATGAIVKQFSTGLGISLSAFNGFEGGLAVFGQPQSGGADVQVTMSAAPSPVQQNSNLTYTIVVKNNGLLSAANVAMTDVFPAGVTFVSSSSTVGTCAGTTTVTCNLGTMTNGQTATITIVVTATQTGALTNTVNVTSTTPDPITSDNTATTTTTVNGATFVTLHVATAGNATGLVTDNASIGCSQVGVGGVTAGNCSAQYATGTQVILTATTPGTLGSISGTPTACTVSGNTCTITITGAETVTATFNPGPGAFGLTVQAGATHTGGGSVTSSPTGINNCTLVGTTTANQCSTTFPAGTLVTLTQTPGAGSNFIGWSGTSPACLTSSALTCVLGMSAVTTAELEYSSNGATVALTVTGPGAVKDTANANAINCSNTVGGTQTGTCSFSYALGTPITLTETPAGGTFTTWTGAVCTNPTAATCSFTVTTATTTNVSATFAASGPPPAPASAVAVNPVTNKIYEINSTANSVKVIDGASGTTSTVAVGTAPAGVAVNPFTNKIYVANGGSGNVTVIDGVTNATTNVAAGTSPASVAVNPVTNKIYVANSGSANVTVIDGVANTTATVAAGTNPSGIALNPVTNKIYVANNGSGNVTVIDGATNTTATVTVGTNPSGVAVDPLTGKIYVANSGSANVTVIDGTTNATTPVAAGTNPISVAVNVVTDTIYVANNGSSNVTVINGATNATATVAAGTNPIGIAVDATTNRIYVSNEGSNNVTAINGADNSTTTLTAGTAPDGIGVNPVTDKIYVGNTGDGSVSTFDGSTNTSTTVAVGTAPVAVAVNSATNKIYVANNGSSNVTVIDGVTSATATVTVGANPKRLAVNPITNKIYVIGSTITVIDGATNTTTNIPCSCNASTTEDVAVNTATNTIYVTVATLANGLIVIDGATNTTTSLAVDQSFAVAVNPVTNRIYLANFNNSVATVVDGSTNTILTTVPAGTNPTAVAVNTLTNKIYVANNGSNNVTVIDGSTNTPTTVSDPNGIQPSAVVVNSTTNKAYVLNTGNDGVTPGSVTVIDGATNNFTNVNIGLSILSAMAINPTTNKIYVANNIPSFAGTSNVRELDGVTNTVQTVLPTGAAALAVNPATNAIFAPLTSVSVIADQQVQAIPLTATTTPLAGNSTTSTTPTFTFTSASTFAPINPPVNALYFQMDATTGPWLRATSTGGSGFTGTAPTLPSGTHIIYAYATDSQEATSNMTTAVGGSSPLVGAISAYTFAVTSQAGPGPATHFSVTVPANATAGTAFSVTVTALDASNNIASGYAGTVTFTSSDGQAVLPANSPLTAGAGTFSATLKTAGSQTVTATDTVTSSITGTSTAISVSAAAATHLIVSAPASATTGTAFSFTITARDQFNNTATAYTGTVHFTSSDANAVLPANSTLTNGVGTFSATLKTTGSQTITATDTVTGSITGTSGTITIAGAGAATHFQVTATTPQTAGVAFSVTVTALDASNATATGYTGTVHFTSSDGQAVLPANSTLTAGTGTFSVTLKTAGSQTVVATDTVTASITGASAAIIVSPAAAARFTVAAPAAATNGTAFNFTVTALDAFNNTATGYAGTVHFTSSDGAATLPVNSTLTAGVKSFSATLNTNGAQTVTATDTVTGSITGTSGTITVSSPVATHFSVSAPATATVGTAINFTVTALTAANTTATTYTGTVHFTSTDGAAVLPANSTLTNGVGTFSATLNTVGSKTITATDTVTASITGTSGAISVSAVATPLLTVTTAGTGTGTVAGSGINCKSGSNNGCTASITAGTQVTLMATADAGSAFTNWNAVCPSLTSATCTFTMPATATGIMATFTKNPATLQSIAVTPANPTEPINSTVQFHATGTFSDQSTKDITATVTWASSNTDAATIVPGGLATTGGNADLSTTISASLDDVTGSTLLTLTNSPITISVTPPPGGTIPPVPPGGKLAVGIVLTATPGFSGTVTFGCTVTGADGQPAPSITCIPDPANVTITPGGPSQVAIVVNTFCTGNAAPLSTPNPGGFGGGLGLLLLGLTLGGAALTFKRRSPQWALSFAVLTLIAIGGSACSSLPKGPSGATPPGNYTLTITATVNGTTSTAPPINFTVE